jgi:hypothetical protein
MAGSGSVIRRRAKKSTDQAPLALAAASRWRLAAGVATVIVLVATGCSSGGEGSPSIGEAYVTAIAAVCDPVCPPEASVVVVDDVELAGVAIANAFPGTEILEESALLNDPAPFVRVERSRWFTDATAFGVQVSTQPRLGERRWFDVWMRWDGSEWVEVDASELGVTETTMSM